VNVFDAQRANRFGAACITLLNCLDRVGQVRDAALQLRTQAALTLT